MKRTTINMPETPEEIAEMAKSFWTWYDTNEDAQDDGPLTSFITWLRNHNSTGNDNIRIEIGNNGDMSVGIIGEEWTFNIDPCQAGNEVEIIRELEKIFNDFCEFPAEYIFSQDKRIPVINRVNLRNEILKSLATKGNK